MTGARLSRVLRDFGAAADTRPAESETEPPATAMARFTPGEDVMAERLREARAGGEEAGSTAARAEHERELAELRASAEKQLAEERRRWVAEQGDVLAASLTSALDSLETRIAGPVARILTPFLTDRLRDDMVRDLSESVTRLVSGGHCGRLRISGPADLLGGLREKLGPCPATIEWAPNEQPDVTLIADDSIIETDIGSWIDRFREAAR